MNNLPKVFTVKKVSFHITGGPPFNRDYQLVVNHNERYIKLYKNVGDNKWEQVKSDWLEKGNEEHFQLLDAVGDSNDDAIQNLMVAIAAGTLM